MKQIRAAFVVLVLAAVSGGAVCVPAAAASGGGGAGRISLVSVGLDGGGADDATGVSAHGRYVVFSSSAADLVVGDTNEQRDVFVRDLGAGHTTLVSVGIGGVLGNGESQQASISADGRYVVFTSYASNLLPGDTNDSPDVFLRDLRAGRTTLVSVGLNGPADLGAYQPEISSNGGHVSFTSAATNLVAGDTNDTADIFVRDLRARRTERVSLTAAGMQSDNYASDATISADGRIVAFVAGAVIEPGPQPPVPTVSVIFVHDRTTKTTRAVSPGVTADPRSFFVDTGEPELSADGRFVVFSVIGSVGPDWISNVWLRDLRTNRLELISADQQGLPSTAFGGATGQVSADGRYVAFGTMGRMTGTDQGDLSDVFRLDRKTGSLVWITHRQDQTNTFGRIGSWRPMISDDGQHVAFTSDDTFLVPGGGATVYDTYLWSSARRR